MPLGPKIDKAQDDGLSNITADTAPKRAKVQPVTQAPKQQKVAGPVQQTLKVGPQPVNVDPNGGVNFDGSNNQVVTTNTRGPNVYCNTFETTIEQRYFNNGGGGSLDVGTVVGSTFTGLAPGTTQLGFNSADGFGVVDLGGGLARVTLTGGGGGSSGYSGWSGAAGTPGTPGAQGSSGYSGVAGTPGVSGYSGAAGAGTPAGSDTEVQFNDGGVFGADPGLTYDKSTGTVSFDSLQNVVTSIGVTVGQPVSNSWISLYGDLGTNVNDEYSSAVAYDTTGNIYSIGADGNNGTPFLVKYSPAGTLLNQINFTEINNYYKTGDAVEVDSSGNVYVSIGTDDSASNFTLVKLDPALSILWQLEFDDLNTEVGVDLAFDSAGNIILLGVISNTNVGYVAKISAAGSIIWQRTQTGSSNAYPTGVALDSSDNIYINSQESAAITSPILLKYDSSGALQWQVQYSNGVDTLYSGQVGVDSTGNVYTINSGYGYGYVIIKWDATGTVLWQKFVAVGPTSSVNSTGLAIDTTDDLYVSAEVSGVVYIHKFDASGVQLWQRTFTGANEVDQYYYWATQNLALLGSYYTISGYTYTPDIPNAEAIVVQLPTDGSGTGAFNKFVYGVGSLAIATGTLTTAAGGLVDAAGALTPTTGTLITAAASGTATLIPVTGINNWYFNIDGSTSTPNYTLPGIDGSCNNTLFTDGTGCVRWKHYLSLTPNGSFLTNPTPLNACAPYNIGIGLGTLCNSINYGNIAVGINGLTNVTTASNNIAVGSFAGTNLITGSNNTIIGQLTASAALESTVLIGAGACERVKVDGTGLYINGVLFSGGGSPATPTSLGTVFGYTTGGGNTAIGCCAGNTTMTSTDNIAIGCNSLKVNSGGFYNTAIGFGTLTSNITGSSNIAVGWQTMACNTGGTRNVAIGDATLFRNTTGQHNIAQGYQSLYNNNSGYGNIAVGNRALYQNTTGCNNIGIGYYAGYNITTGVNNIAIGCQSLTSAAFASHNIAIGKCSIGIGSSGCCNTAVGYGALFGMNTGRENIAIGTFSQSQMCNGCGNISLGACALYFGGNNNGNIAVGSLALYCGSSLGFNIGIGESALKCGTGCFHNIALGTSALYGYTGGTSNIAIGYASMFCGAQGGYNVSIGRGSMSLNLVTGTYNTAVGSFAMQSVNGGSFNIGIGPFTLSCNSVGCGHIAIGPNSLVNATGGCNNIAMGCNSLFCNTASCNSIAIGFEALKNSTATEVIGIGVGASQCAGGCNIGIGTYAGRNAGSNDNISIGRCAMAFGGSIGNVAIGNGAMCNNATGCYNIAIGTQALQNSATSNNIAVGLLSLGCTTTGFENIGIGNYTLRFNTGGACNISVGCSALCCNTTGSGNIALGLNALKCSTVGINNIAAGFAALCTNTTGINNVALGVNTLLCNTIGSCNTAIGHGAGFGLTTGVNNVFIGFNSAPATVTSSNTITLGDSSITTIRAQVTSITTLSDIRDKCNVCTLPVGLDFVRELKPVKFTWSMRSGAKVGVDEAGFIAQDLKALIEKYGVRGFLDLVLDDNPDRLEASPGKLIPVLVRAIQELADRVEKLESGAGH